jgi:hypothetical protein
MPDKKDKIEAQKRFDAPIRRAESLLRTLKIQFDPEYFVPDLEKADSYLHHDRSSNYSSGDVWIPLGKKERIHYYGSVVGGTSDRPIGAYQYMLFSDVFCWPKPSNKPGGFSIERFLAEVPKLESAEPVFGGFEAAFAPGKVVLDIASGEAVAALQLAMKFPEATIIGVDHLYQANNRVFLNRPGLQLTHGDWRYLENIPDASIDTILSCQGVTMWGLESNVYEEDKIKIVQSLKRVSKVGTVLRFDGYVNESAVQFLIEHLGSDWDVRSLAKTFAARRMK